MRVALLQGVEGVVRANQQVLADRYVLGAEIGRGGCAVIHEALDLRESRSVAVKLLKSDKPDAQTLARFTREARASEAIDHPNVCRMEDSGRLPDGRPYLVMELLRGETLTQRIRHGGTLSSYEAIDVAFQILAALDAVHRAGIVHRDIKPDNIFLVPRTNGLPLVKLLDFGMCRRVAPQHHDDITLTRAGQVVGTPEYMSPEQVSGKRTFDALIDLYAVGVILYEVLCGQRAFPGRDPHEIVRAVLVREVRPLRAVRPDVSPLLEAVVKRGMARERRARFASASEFQAALREARTELEERYRRVEEMRAARAS